MEASLSEWLADCHPRERHKYTGKLIRDFCEVIAKKDPYLSRDFEEVMKRHGY